MPKPEFHTLSSGRIAILAGSGRLPEILAEELDSQGKPPLLIDFSGDVTRWASRHDAIAMSPAHLSTILKRLKTMGVSRLVMAGGMVGMRPRLGDFQINWTFLRFAVSAVRALMKGDNGLLATTVRLLEREGFEVLSAQDIAPHLLAGQGTMTRRQPERQDEVDIFVAITSARDLGRKDIGQASIARNGVIVALETRRGTAAMLNDMANHREDLDMQSGVLAKISKPGQELRVDLPAIGPDTVAQAAKAGLRGIVVEAGHALMIDRTQIIRQADELELFVCARSLDAHES